MIVSHEEWKDIPLLHIYKDEWKDTKVPVFIFLHGFTSAKEHNLHYAYQLVEKGFRVLLPDALLHGVRDLSLDDVQMAMRFWEIILTSIEEVNVLHEELMARQLIDSETKIGVGGTSMGAIETLGCLTVYPWIDAAAVMMGCPTYVALAEMQLEQYAARGVHLPITEDEKAKIFKTLSLFDLSQHKEKLADRPVYFWHAKNDPVVPFQPAKTFYDEVKELYAEHPEDFVFVEHASNGHAVSRSGMLGAMKFIADHLE